MADTVRLNLEVSPEIKAKLEELRDRSGATTNVETFRKALSLFDQVVDHVQAGGRLVLVDKDGKEERIRLLI